MAAQGLCLVWSDRCVEEGRIVEEEEEDEDVVMRKTEEDDTQHSEESRPRYASGTCMHQRHDPAMPPCRWGAQRMPLRGQPWMLNLGDISRSEDAATIQSCPGSRAATREETSAGTFRLMNYPTSTPTSDLAKKAPLAAETDSLPRHGCLVPSRTDEAKMQGTPGSYEALGNELKHLPAAIPTQAQVKTDNCIAPTTSPTSPLFDLHLDSHLPPLTSSTTTTTTPHILQPSRLPSPPLPLAQQPLYTLPQVSPTVPVDSSLAFHPPPPARAAVCPAPLPIFCHLQQRAATKFPHSGTASHSRGIGLGLFTGAFENTSIFPGPCSRERESAYLAQGKIVRF
ncbi:hypothetical protein Q7P37_007043 [Cladosporium fusiforme]